MDYVVEMRLCLEIENVTPCGFSSISLPTFFGVNSTFVFQEQGQFENVFPSKKYLGT